MAVIELSPEQQRTLEEKGAVVLSDVAVVRLDVYRRSMEPLEPIEGPRRLPDPPLEPTEVLPPIELPRTNPKELLEPLEIDPEGRWPDPVGFEE